VRVRLPDQLSVPIDGTSCTAGACVTYEVSDGAIEVIVPDAPGERQGAASSISTSRPGERVATRASSWSCSTDPSGVAVCWNRDSVVDEGGASTENAYGATSQKVVG
jgi:hypothetical protein